MTPSRGRPLGEVSRALLSAWASGPCEVTTAAARACVGYDVARFKAKDLVRAGLLVSLSDARPRVLGLPDAAAPVGMSRPGAGEAFVMLARSFWERGPGEASGPA